jgi:hypothetical protein
MAKKRVIQRKDRNAPVEQTRATKTVVPRSNKYVTQKGMIYSQTENFVVIESSYLMKKGTFDFDPQKFQEAAKKFPGKVIAARVTQTNWWIDKTTAFDASGNKHPGLEAIQEAKMITLSYYNSGLSNPAKDSVERKQAGKKQSETRRKDFKERSARAKEKPEAIREAKRSIEAAARPAKPRSDSIKDVTEKQRIAALRETEKRLIKRTRAVSDKASLQKRIARVYAEKFNEQILKGIKGLGKKQSKYLVKPSSTRKKIVDEIVGPAKKQAEAYVKGLLRGELPDRRLSPTARSIYKTQDKFGRRIRGKHEKPSPRQYEMVEKDTGAKVIVYATKERVAARKKAQANREARAQQREALRAERERKRVESRARAKENRRRRDVARSAALRTMKRRSVTAKAKAYAKRVSALSGFRRVPLKMLLAGKPGIKGTRGNMTALQSYGTGRQILSKRSGSSFAESRSKGVRNIPRSMMYPPMRHSKGKPYPIIKKMLKPVSGRLTLENISGKMTPTKWFGGKGSMYAVSQTVDAPKPVVGGRGVLFAMGMPMKIDFDTLVVMTNLTLKYPQAIKKAIVNASGTVGRKLLDIVEPYVPKDTGLLYSSATTNVDQTSGGMIDMIDNTAFPDTERYGVSISYNAPYAEIVYFGSHAHGEEYNRKHGVMEKDSRETARWIEVAFEAQQITLNSLLDIYARHVTAGLNVASSKMR